MARPESSSLGEVLDRILDKGIVVDTWARISVIGLEIITVEMRVAAASIDTFLSYAESVSKVERATESGETEEFRELDIETRPESRERTPVSQ